MAGTASLNLATGAPTDTAFGRLWHGFMTARAMIALMLLLLHGSIYLIGDTGSPWAIVFCAAYLMACVGVRLTLSAPMPGPRLDMQWPATIGLDVLAYATLQFVQAAGINYTALFALPVLLGSVLGSRVLGLGTAAAVTLFLLFDAWLKTATGIDPAARFFQAGLIGFGLLVLALLANQVAARLLREEDLARRNQLAARAQIQVNELVIETLSDGILVVDAEGMLRVANPAAQRMLNASPNSQRRMPLPLLMAREPRWQELAALARDTLTERTAQTADLSLVTPGSGNLRIRVRTRLTALPHGEAGSAGGMLHAPDTLNHMDSLCVMFLEDLREQEARVRTEKLAAMGRMSTAVAHEIRNPLAAMSQANALLAEDLHKPEHRQLTEMIAHNALRLNQIVEDVLNVSRIQPHDPIARSLPLDAAVHQCCTDWLQQSAAAGRLRLQLNAPQAHALFEADHLRRILVNLLDNALRHTPATPAAIVVSTSSDSDQPVQLSVWSDASPLEAAVQRHLFEPFFSSESRSTGLGLYICRELCVRHGASIGYRRRRLNAHDGNDFFITFQSASASAGSHTGTMAADRT